MNKTLLAFVVIVSMSGCAVPLTKEAQQVRKLQADTGSTECEFLGTDTTYSQYGSHPAECMRNGKQRLRNRVAELGGNAYVLTHASGVNCMTGFYFDFEIYRCK